MYIGPPKESIPLAHGVYSVLDPGLYLCTARRTGKEGGAGDRENKLGHWYYAQ